MQGTATSLYQRELLGLCGHEVLSVVDTVWFSFQAIPGHKLMRFMRKKNVWNCITKFKFLKIVTDSTTEYKEIIKLIMTLTTVVLEFFIS